MAINVKFYKFNKRVNSTKRPTTGSEFISISCNLKENCSIENPKLVVDLSAENLDFNDITEVNYASFLTTASGSPIYFFIDDCISLNYDQVEIQLTKDVLATYKTSIGNYNAFVERSSSSVDNDIPDLYLTKGLDIIKTSKTETDLTSPFNAETGTYFMRTLSGNGISLYCSTGNYMPSLLMPSPSYSSWNDVIDSVEKATYNPQQYICDYYWLPVTFGVIPAKHSEVTNDLCAGYFKKPYAISEVKEIRTGLAYNFVITINKPETYYNDWRNYDDNWTEYYIYLPYVGQSKLASRFLEETLRARYLIDIETGAVTVKLSTNKNGLIGTYYGNCKINQQYGTSGSSVTGMINGITNVLTSATSGSIGAVASAGVDAVKSEFAPTPNSNGLPNGNKSDMLNNNKIVLSAISYKSAENMKNVMGLPLYKNVVINTLSGFIKCSGASVPVPAHDIDIEKINTYLNTGFYYE